MNSNNGDERMPCCLSDHSSTGELADEDQRGNARNVGYPTDTEGRSDRRRPVAGPHSAAVIGMPVTSAANHLFQPVFLDGLYANTPLKPAYTRCRAAPNGDPPQPYARTAGGVPFHFSGGRTENSGGAAGQMR